MLFANSTRAAWTDRGEHLRSLGPPLLPPPLLAGAVVVPRTAGFRSVPAAPGGSERKRKAEKGRKGRQ